MGSDSHDNCTSLFVCSAGDISDDNKPEQQYLIPPTIEDDGPGTG